MNRAISHGLCEPYRSTVHLKIEILKRRRVKIDVLTHTDDGVRSDHRRSLLQFLNSDKERFLKVALAHAPLAVKESPVRSGCANLPLPLSFSDLCRVLAYKLGQGTREDAFVGHLKVDRADYLVLPFDIACRDHHRSG